MKQVITDEVIKNAYTYTAYRQMLGELMAEGKTTGPNQGQAMIEYANLNLHRMNRLDKTVKINAEIIKALDSLDKNWIWLVITEGWCGDAAQSVPVLHQIALQNARIDFRLILRDENLEVMDAYLTNGGRSIPVMVCLEAETLMPLGHWGPRPAELQTLFLEMKKQNIPFEQLATSIHEWYKNDKTQSIQKELSLLIKNWIKY